MKTDCTVSGYLLERLRGAGVGHLFGVPGDYVLDFLDQVVAGELKWVGNRNELNAGYAADGYARVRGAGAAVVTYGVGGFSILNAVAGAFAERVPLVVISGAPPAHRREAGALVHHLVSDYYLQRDIFARVTSDAFILTDAEAAPGQIDRAIGNCLARKLPVYLEIPADMVHAPCRPPGPPPATAPPPSDGESLAECAGEAAARLAGASRPMILAGPELSRFGLGGAALELVERAEVPFATMLGSKSVLPELHPQFAGIYQGGWSRETVRRQVEESDCLLSLGVWLTDLDTGLFSVNLDPGRVITAGEGRVRIGSHHYHRVGLGDFIRELTGAVEPRSYLSSHPIEHRPPLEPFQARGDRGLTAARLYQCLDNFLDDEMVLLAEPGDAFCAAPEFHIEEADNFIVQSYYASIGYCTPAALGVGLGAPGKRPVVLTGDGAFQMTAQEVSTLAGEGVPAVIVIVNNDGYLIERMLHRDAPYNDIPMWDYSRLPGVFDGGSRAVGIHASTEAELEEAMAVAGREREKLVLIEARLAGRDCSPGMKRLSESFLQTRGKK